MVETAPLAPGVTRRMVQTRTGELPITMLEGRRVMFAYPCEDFYADVKVEILPTDNWNDARMDRAATQALLRHAQRRKGDFSREISPSLFRFFGDPARLPDHNVCIAESLGSHELRLALAWLFYDHTRCKNFSLPSVSSCLDRVSSPIL